MANPPPLEITTRDRITAIARAVVAACPFIGGALAEALTAAIPKQRFDRAIEWIRVLDSRVGALEGGVAKIAERLQTAEGLDLLGEAVVQATRAQSADRRARLASLLTRSLTQEELKYEESAAMLRILD